MKYLNSIAILQTPVVRMLNLTYLGIQNAINRIKQFTGNSKRSAILSTLYTTLLASLLTPLIGILAMPLSHADSTKNQNHDIIIWNYISQHYQTLKELATEFNAQQNTRQNSQLKDKQIKIELVELSQLDEKFKNSAIPDGLFFPSDRVSFSEPKLTAISKDWLDPETTLHDRFTVTVDGNLFGVPIFSGNHLILFYNKSLVQKVPNDWSDILRYNRVNNPEGNSTIGWYYQEAYWFVAFWSAFGINPVETGNFSYDTINMRRALSWYKSLSELNLLDPSCDNLCNRTKFFKGQIPFAILHEFDLADAEKSLGDKLGIAALPNLRGERVKSLSSTIALMLTEAGNQRGSKQTIREFARFLQSEPIQKRLLKKSTLIVSKQSVYQDPEVQKSSIHKQAYLTRLNTIPMPPVDMSNRLWIPLGQWLSPYLAGEIDLETTIKNLNESAGN